MFRVTRFVLTIAVLYSVASLAAAEDKPELALPRLHPEDEGFLLQMREQLHGGEAPRWLEGAPPEKRLEWFKHGLRQAAANPPQPAFHAPPYQQAPPPAWRRLLEAAMQLEHVAHALDQQQLWEPANQVRKTAAELRRHARKQSSDGPQRQDHRGRNPRNRDN